MWTNAEFSGLAEKYMDMIFRLAYTYLKNPYDADDVTQEVLLQLYKAEKPFASEAHIKNWLIRVTINRCKNMFRGFWQRYLPIEDYASSLSFESPEQSDLFLTVMGLDKKYRIPLMLYYYDGYSIREISQLLSLPEKTVVTRLLRGRKQLKIN